MRKSIIWALAIAAVVGCKKETVEAPSSGGGEVAFSSASIATRTLETDDYITVWASGDKLGISAAELNYSNVEYEVSGEGGAEASFAAAGDQRIYISDSFLGGVTYQAFYPTSAYVGENSYKINTADQSNYLEELDLLYAQTTVDYSGDDYDTPVEFTFDHALAKVLFLVSYDDGELVSDPSVTICDVTTSALYSVEDGAIGVSGESGSGDVEMFYAGYSDSDYRFVAIMHPLSYSGAGLVFELDGTEYYATYPSSEALVAGKIYTHEVTIGSEGVTFGELTIDDWTESPEDGDFEYTVSAVWDGTIAEGFAGTYGSTVAYDDNIDNYYIQTGAQLAYLASLVDEGYEMEGKTFILMNDIDLDGREWEPIGYNYWDDDTESDVSSGFSGIFKGQDYTISGLSITEPEILECVGLFSYVTQSGSVKDLSIEGSVALATSDTYGVGGFVGYNVGTIDGCYFSGEVSGYMNIGGIVGSNEGTISHCGNRATITGEQKVGGIVGYSDGGTIESCYNTGAIDNSDLSAYSVGGIVGMSFKGVISGCHNNGTVTGKRNVGGVVGYLQGKEDSYAYIFSCYNLGDLSVTDTYCGGVVGYATTYSDIQYIFSSSSSSLYPMGSYNSNYPIAYVGKFDEYLEITYSDNHTSTDGSTYLLTALSDSSPNTWGADEDGVNGGYPVLVDMNYVSETYE